MRIRTELNKLQECDIYSLLLFSLYKLKDAPEYSSLSELVYVLDKTNFLRLCEYFGGTTIRIPTIQEITILTESLLLYSYTHIDNMSYTDALNKLAESSNNITEVKTYYNKLLQVLQNYKFEPRKALK